MRAVLKIFVQIQKIFLYFTRNKCDTFYLMKNPSIHTYLNEDGEYVSAVDPSNITFRGGRLTGQLTHKQTITDYPVVRVPKCFLDDHVERECPTPAIVRETSNYYFIAAIDCDGWEDLVSDADFYCDPYGPDAEYLHGIKKSAKATLKAMREVTPVAIKRSYKIEMFAHHIPAWGWFELALDKLTPLVPFLTRKSAREYIKTQDLEGHGFDFRVVPC